MHFPTVKEKSGGFPIVSAIFGFCFAASHPASVYFEIFGARTLPLLALIVIFFLSLPFTLSRFKPSFLHLLYLLFTIWLAIGLAYSSGKQYGVTKTVQVLFNWLLLSLAIYHLFASERSLRSFFFGLLCGGLAVLALTMYIYGNPADLIHHTTRFFRLHLGDDKDNPIFFARVLGLGVLATLWLMLTYRKAYLFAIGIPTALATLGYMFLTGSKGPLLALIIAILIGSLYLNAKAKFLVVAFLAAVSLAAVIVVGSASSDFITQRFDQSTGTGISVSSRLKSYVEAKNFILQRASPAQVLLGVGTGGYGSVIGAGDIRIYAHNIILEVATENGLLGALLLLAVLITPLLMFHRFFSRRVKAILSVERRVLLVTLFVGYIAALLNAQFSADVGSNFWIAVFGALLVCAINTIKRNLSRESFARQAVYQQQSFHKPKQHYPIPQFSE
jgi:O-antigen ligase